MKFFCTLNFSNIYNSQSLDPLSVLYGYPSDIQDYPFYPDKWIIYPNIRQIYPDKRISNKLLDYLVVTLATFSASQNYDQINSNRYPQFIQRISVVCVVYPTDIRGYPDKLSVYPDRTDKVPDRISG